MQAQGMLFLSRTPPQAQTAADGSFCLQLYTVDRIAAYQVESWVVFWHGPAAKAFWEANRARLKPGAAIRADIQRLRAHIVGRCMPEIHAQASQVQLVQTAGPTRCAETLAH